jgi:hypothetical protein
MRTWLNQTDGPSCSECSFPPHQCTCEEERLREENESLRKALNQAIDMAGLTVSVGGNIGSFRYPSAPVWQASYRPELAAYLRKRSEAKQAERKGENNSLPLTNNVLEDATKQEDV